MTAKPREPWKRIGDWIRVGEGMSAWSFPIPDTSADKSMAGALHYLLVVCPDTKTACAKLTTMRRILRELPPTPPKEGDPRP